MDVQGGHGPMSMARHAILCPNGRMDVIPWSKWVMCMDKVPHLWMDYIMDLHCISMIMDYGIVTWTL